MTWDLLTFLPLSLVFGATPTRQAISLLSIAYKERIMDLRKEEAILEYRLDLAEEKGKKIGKEEGKIEVAKAMLASNVDVNTIVKFTGLSISEIEELSGNL